MIVNGRFLSQAITGVQRYAVEMTRELLRLRPETRVVAPRNVIHHDLLNEFNAVTIGRGTGYFWEQVELPRYLKRLRPQPELINLANLAPLTYDRNIVVIHDTAPLRHPEWYSRRFAFVYRWLLPRIARRALHVVTDSQFSASEIGQLLGVRPDRLSVIPGAVATCFQGCSTGEPPTGNESYVLSVGSMNPRKNLAALVDAYMSLERSDVKLLIAGNEHHAFASSQLPTTAHRNGRIRFVRLAGDEDLVNLYRNATLFVFPSLYEGFGLPPLEAMACGCPCLVAESASLPEVCGDAAAYCDPNNTQDIAQNIEALLDDVGLRSLYRDRGYTRARSFSWRDSARALLDIARKHS